MSNIVSILSKISTPPDEPSAFNEWLKQADAIEFLKQNAEQDEFVMFASIRAYTFMHAVLVPASSLVSPNIKDLMNWDCNPSSSWGIEIRFSEPREIWITSPLEGCRSKTIAGGEQLVFTRGFEGSRDRKSYCEILQKFTHAFELHLLEERNAYCRLDMRGDIEEVVRIISIPRVKGDEFGGEVVTFKRDVLDEYLAFTKSSIVRTFDFTRYRSGFFGWNNQGDIEHFEEPDFFYRFHIEPDNGSYTRGCQIVRSKMPIEAIINKHDFSAQKKEQQHATFLAYDWKNRVLKEISCAPGHTANYFTNSDLPFEITPAFFRPEVLSKYKADSEKYHLKERSISCRGAWHLETYDINEEGQVHTYLVYLRNLPYEEQLYWKSYNEAPKGPISKRAIKTDFEGSWDFDYDPLVSLKQTARELNHDGVPWWTLRSEELLDQLHYPVTTSADEWSNELLHLDQLIVEGFEVKWLKNKAQSLGRVLDPKYGSLLLVYECLLGYGLDVSEAQKLIAPLRDVHDLRSKTKGHASGQEATRIRSDVRRKHGSYKKHFRYLVAECDGSLRRIADAFKQIDKQIEPQQP